MKLIALLFTTTCLATVFASETLNEAVEKLKTFEFRTPLELVSNLLFIKTHIHGVGVAGSSLLITDLLDSGLVNRIVNDYSVETFEDILDLNLFSQEALFAPFKPIQSSLSAANPIFEHYKMLCKRLALSFTNDSESFSAETVEMRIRLGLKDHLLREVLFGLITFRTVLFADLVQVLDQDPFMLLARAEYFEVLLAAIHRFRIPPNSRIQSAEFGPERQSLKEYTRTINPELSALL